LDAKLLFDLSLILAGFYILFKEFILEPLSLKSIAASAAGFHTQLWLKSQM
jgi:hypothetical protein